MKAAIRDSEVLRTVQPLELTAYLRAHHWREVDQQEGRYTIWQPSDNQIDAEVMVPASSIFRDYPNRIAEALQVLEVVEQRSQLAIVSDINNVSADVVRIGAEHERMRDGTIPLEQGRLFIEHIHGLIYAAACGAVRARPVFFSRRPAQATEYMRQVRLGQSERGSYVVTVQSPIRPALRLVPRQSSFLPDDDPFERRVTRTLMLAVRAVLRAASRAVATGELAPFVEVVQQGVSANLCDALVGMHEGTDAQNIRLRTSWAPSRAVTDDLPVQLIVSSDAIPVIKEASRYLRETTPRDDFELQGFVVKLEREENAQSGRITVSGVIDQVFKNVQLQLDAHHYRLAVKAHDQRAMMRCEGELVREGRSFELRNPRNIEFFGLAEEPKAAP
ncbi:MAG: hypothetical protein OHK0022_18440 [Roseiflexaceae bacterium]